MKLRHDLRRQTCVLSALIREDTPPVCVIPVGSYFISIWSMFVGHHNVECICSRSCQRICSDSKQSFNLQLFDRLLPQLARLSQHNKAWQISQRQKILWQSRSSSWKERPGESALQPTPEVFVLSFDCWASVLPVCRFVHGASHSVTINLFFSFHNA